MSDPTESFVERAFAHETRHVMARRVPLGVGFSIVLVALAGLVEWYYFPDRIRPLLTTFAGELPLAGIAVLAARHVPLRRWLIPIVASTTVGIAVLVATYVVTVGASADALAFALIIFLAGVALLFPWGAPGQVPVALGAVVAYLAAVGLGVRGGLPLPYGILSVCGGAVTSVLGAVFLDLHRAAIFRQRLLLERTLDRQMAMLYDVTRTLTSTLELPQVLWLVCQSVLDALNIERLWLLWRAAPEGELHGLKARRGAHGPTATALHPAPERWEHLLDGVSTSRPDLLSGAEIDATALGIGAPSPADLLRLPLYFRSELVGIVLAERPADKNPLEPSFVEFATTLANSAAMAIANARLHALVVQQRQELEEISNRRVDVVEEGLRRLSRELHDGVCQSLMVIKLDLALLERRLPAGCDDLGEAIHDIRSRVLDVAQGIRQMSHLLHPPVLDDFGVVAAIESVADKYRKGSGLDVHVESGDGDIRLAPAIELMMFRMFQEALLNVVKHARATRVRVRLAVEERAVVLEVEDDGRGFDAHGYLRSPPKSAGLGLIGMRERIAHFGGAFQVTSRPGAGTRIVLSVPIDRATAARAAAS